MLKKIHKKQNNTFLWIFIFLSIFVLINLFFPISKPIQNSILNITAPALRSMKNFGNNLFPTIGILKDSKEVKDEIDLLRKENNKLLSIFSKTKILEEESKALKALLGIELEEKNIEIVEVLGREMGEHNIIIRHKNQIKVDNAVTTPEGVLIGFVTETNKNISRVQLLTNKESAIEAKIINENYPIGVLRGGNQKTLHIETLPKNKDIKRGNMVVGQSYNGMALNDVYIGRIVNITDHDVEPFLSADIYQGVDLRYINYLFVIDKWFHKKKIH